MDSWRVEDRKIREMRERRKGRAMREKEISDKLKIDFKIYKGLMFD